MSMFELSLLVPQDEVEPASDALIDELAALSVSVEDADAGTDAERALFGEPGMPAPEPGWQRSVVRSLFANEANAASAATLLLAQDWAAGIRLQSIKPVPDEDWVRLTQAQFAPVPITADFWIVPSWHQPPAEATRAIRLDPGLAFGTGTHPTTRMCLRWTAAQAPARSARWSRVLDYGCGSGILAIGAALFGAAAIDAVDIDPAAVEATRANALANGVADQLSAGLPETAAGAYPLIFANILATPLKLLAPLLCSHLAAGGELVLAGILERQADELAAAYAPWLDLRVADTEDGWILMTGCAWPDATEAPATLAMQAQPAGPAAPAVAAASATSAAEAAHAEQGSTAAETSRAAQAGQTAQAGQAAQAAEAAPGTASASQAASAAGSSPPGPAVA